MRRSTAIQIISILNAEIKYYQQEMVKYANQELDCNKVCDWEKATENRHEAERCRRQIAMLRNEVNNRKELSGIDTV